MGCEAKPSKTIDYRARRTLACSRSTNTINRATVRFACVARMCIIVLLSHPAWAGRVAHTRAGEACLVRRLSRIWPATPTPTYIRN